MPYPSANARGQTTPGTALEVQRNGIPGGVGNAHTIRGTANDLGMIGAPMDPYAYAYRQVVFDGTDYLSNATALGLAPSDTFTVAVAVRFNNLSSASGTVLGITTGIGNAALIAVSSAGAITFNTPSNGSTTGYLGGVTAAGVIQPNVDYVIHLVARASTNTISLFVNGATVTITGGAWLGTGNFPAPTAWTIGAQPGGATPIGGSGGARLGLAWFDVGQFITDPTKFFPAYDLGTTLALPAAQPAIGFGNVQGADARSGNTAQGWNDGFNQGDGTGTWTVTGTLVDA
jgi:hypothetical protein